MEETTPQKEAKESVSEREKSVEQLAEELVVERKPELEKDILAEQQKVAREEVEKKISAAKLTPELEKEAETKAEEMKELGEEGKLGRLLKIAEEKDVAFAFGVAKDLNDPYILDRFHDLVIEKGLHKKLEE